MLKTLACPLAGLRPTSVGLTTNDPGAGTMGERDSSWFPRQVGLGMCVGNWRLPSFPLGPALSVVSLPTQKGPRPPQQALTPPTPSGQSAEPPKGVGLQSCRCQPQTSLHPWPQTSGPSRALAPGVDKTGWSWPGEPAESQQKPEPCSPRGEQKSSH